MLVKDLNETNRIKLYTHVTSLLSEGVNSVKFKKSNGEIKSCEATRDPGIIKLDETKVPKSGNKRAPNYKSVPFLDLDSNSWKSMTLDNLIHINDINIDTIMKNIGITENV